jgi:hypothetical protein
MLKKKFLYTQRITRWLLAVGLLYSSLTFSAYEENLPPDSNEITQTEQLDAGANSEKNTALYWLALDFSKNQTALAENILQQHNAVFISLRDYKQQHFVAKKRAYSFKINQFFRMITYPNDSEATAPSYLIG